MVLVKYPPGFGDSVHRHFANVFGYVLQGSIVMQVKGAAPHAALERRTLSLSRLSGIVLRYGFFYGPGTWYWTDGAFADQVIRREVHVVGGGGGVWSFVHVEHAAAATVGAFYTDPGIGAPEPAQVSAENGSAQIGGEGVYAHTRLTGASNSKAKAALAFDPRPLAWMAPRET